MLSPIWIGEYFRKALNETDTELKSMEDCLIKLRVLIHKDDQFSMQKACELSSLTDKVFNTQFNITSDFRCWRIDDEICREQCNGSQLYSCDVDGGPDYAYFRAGKFITNKEFLNLLNKEEERFNETNAQNTYTDIAVNGKFIDEREIAIEKLVDINVLREIANSSEIEKYVYKWEEQVSGCLSCGDCSRSSYWDCSLRGREPGYEIYTVDLRETARERLSKLCEIEQQKD